MSFQHVLWINLAVQILALSVCAVYVQRLAKDVRWFWCFLAEDHHSGFGEWKMDPLTQALIEIDAAKKQGEGQDERLLSLEQGIAAFRAEFKVLLAEFRLVRTIVFGMVGLVCTTALASLLVLIWKTKP